MQKHAIPFRVKLRERDQLGEGKCTIRIKSMTLLEQAQILLQLKKKVSAERFRRGGEKSPRLFTFPKAQIDVTKSPTQEAF